MPARKETDRQTDREGGKAERERVRARARERASEGGVHVCVYERSCNVCRCVYTCAM